MSKKWASLAWNISLQKEIEWLQTQNLDLKKRLRAVASEIKQVRAVSVYLKASEARES